MIAIVGGGVAGISAAVHLAEAGEEVDLFEARKFPGGRARSYPDVPSGEEVDIGQHIVMKATTEILSLYRRLGTKDAIEWQKKIPFLEADERGMFPPPRRESSSTKASPCGSAWNSPRRSCAPERHAPPAPTEGVFLTRSACADAPANFSTCSSSRPSMSRREKQARRPCDSFSWRPSPSPARPGSASRRFPSPVSTTASSSS